MSYSLKMNTPPTPLRAVIRVLWDHDAQVWVATSDDVQGLVVEAASFDEVVQEARQIVPDLLQLNGGTQSKVLDLHFLADRLESVAA